jgi:DNA-binding CsgD family transcriptional regulator
VSERLARTPSLYFSAEGHKLLFLATSSEKAPGMSVGRSTVLPTAVTQPCRSLCVIFADDAAVSAPIYHHSNAWGRFTFRAEWLDHDDPGSGLVAVIVRHEVPLPVRLTRGAAKLPLSSRQAEISVMMAMGASNDAIASRLRISTNTANQHGRSIYNKLEVHSRAELASKILSD